MKETAETALALPLQSLLSLLSTYKKRQTREPHPMNESVLMRPGVLEDLPPSGGELPSETAGGGGG